MICKSNPWKARSCEREECTTCKEEKQTGKCRDEGIIYKITCQECKAKGIESIYIGESSRTIFERYREHLDGERNCDKRNALHKHDMVEHGGVAQKYKVEVLEVHRNAMKWQVMEKVKIERMNKTARLMNSKNEWGGTHSLGL